MDPNALVAPPPADSTSVAAPCLDCGTPLVGPYCHACGQRHQRPDLPLRRLAVDLVGDLFAWDGRVFQTARTLFRSPGTLSVDWALGRRSRHVAPFRLYLLCSLVFVVVSAGYSGVKDLVRDSDTPTEAEEREELRDVFRGTIPAAKVEPAARYTEAMGALGSRWMFVLMPLGGFGLYVLYHHRRPAYTAHFVVAIHVFCVVILAFAARRLVQIVLMLATGQTDSPLNDAINWGLTGVVFVVSFAYAALAIRRFYGVPTWKAVASAPAVTVGPIAAWFALFATGMSLIFAWPS